MTMEERAAQEQRGRLAENIIYFARALRSAGIPVGPGAVLDALEALQTAGIGTRESDDGGGHWTAESAIPLPPKFDQGAANPIAHFDDQAERICLHTHRVLRIGLGFEHDARHARDRLRHRRRSRAIFSAS